MQLPLYFFGDTHFKSSQSNQEKAKVEKFSDFLNSITTKTAKGSLFIMGDFFDYYFEYANQQKSEFDEIFSKIEKMKDSGFEIYFIAGNHDYWIGNYFMKYTNKTFLDDTTVAHKNTSIYVTHGDGILSWDTSYRLLKKVLRSNIFITTYSLLPKSIANKIAEKISYERKDSHEIDQDKLNRIHDELEDFAKEKIAEGHNYVIMGHYHHSYHKIFDGGQLILLGECNENNYNYAIFDGNKLEIKNF
jgi:UDP-2,3-diacylglucosamine hydrolase